MSNPTYISFVVIFITFINLITLVPAFGEFTFNHFLFQLVIALRDDSTLLKVGIVVPLVGSALGLVQF